MIATVFVHKKTAGGSVLPLVVIINTIPVVAKAPILVLLLGNGMEPKIAIAALICFFPTLVNMVRGLESVNPQAMELMRVLSASKTEVFFKLRLYNSLPYLFSALKISASTSVIGAIVGEWIGSTVGIGALIIQATYDFNSALLYATVIVGSCFSVLFFLAITLAERVVVRWQAPVAALNPEFPRRRDDTDRSHRGRARLRPHRRASDVLVVGGGPAGFAAAIAARREGCSVTLVERYPYLGGLASGGMVLVLDDMHNGDEVTVRASAWR